MNNPLVTVILPIYNVEKYLEKCVQTVTQQSYKNLEIILVDDGSTDNSATLCDEWSQKDSRIKVIHKDNAGLGMARNTGLDNSHGEYVVFIDSDDFVETTMIEEYVTHINDSEIIFAGHKIFYDDKNIENQEIRYIGKEFSGKEVKNKILVEMMGALPEDSNDIILPVSVWHGMYKRDIIEQNHIRFPSERQFISEDMIFDVELFKYINKVSFIKGCFYYYRKNNETSLTSVYNPERFSKEIVLYEELNSRLEEMLEEKTYKLRLQRTFLGRVRSCIVRAIRQSTNVNKEVRRICCDDKVQEVLKVYPYSKCNFSLRIFNFCIRHKLVLMIELLVKMRYKNEKYNQK